ncbi:hypothetical protein [Roseimicrobium sp. ORNL1]|uniref:hypothetical protein n=1 Tax=Roseimicrobium sp. ORNL1 TaxID=2711231 RepID=UPI00197CB5B1|nr:hypothetical protein [Roseimicrobium sp. ORNL1]
MATILTWIWSPVPMTLQALTDFGQHPTWPFWHGFLSCVTFGLFFAFLIPWIKRPLYP